MSDSTDIQAGQRLLCKAFWLGEASVVLLCKWKQIYCTKGIKQGFIEINDCPVMDSKE